MNYLPLILTVAAAHFLAVVSPGPDFFLVVKNSLTRSRRTAFYTALGIAAGIGVHVAYSLAGIAFIIAQSAVLFSVIKLLGAGYLIYIGYKSIRAKRSGYAPVAADSDLTSRQAWLNGFITNVTNPKATLFFLSVFTLIISPSTPLVVQLIMGAEMVIATGLWFSALATVLSHQAVRGRMGGIQYYAEKILGAVLIALGLKLAYATK